MGKNVQYMCLCNVGTAIYLEEHEHLTVFFLLTRTTTFSFSPHVSLATCLTYFTQSAIYSKSFSSYNVQRYIYIYNLFVYLKDEKTFHLKLEIPKLERYISSLNKKIENKNYLWGKYIF